jgi:hypothetical protein
MNTRSHSHPASPFRGLLLGLSLLAVAALACSLAGIAPTTGGTSGKFEPAQGLDGLPAYRATYRASFVSPNADPWDETLTLSVLREPSVRALTAESHGDGGTESGSTPAFAAEMGNLLYWRDLPTSGCMSTYASTLPADSSDLGAHLPELAERLPRVTQLKKAGAAESISGVEAQPYTFDEKGLGADGEADAQGQVWLAADTEGGYVVQFHLEMTTDSKRSGRNLDGTYTVDYRLEPIAASVDAVLPLDCPLPLPDIARLEPATHVFDLPGYQEFRTEASVGEAAAFYQQAITQGGWAPVGDPVIGDSRARLAFAAPGQTVEVSIDSGDSTRVSLVGRRVGSAGSASPGGSAGATPETPAGGGATGSAEEPAVRVIDSLNRLLEVGEETADLSSYHLEVEHQGLAWEGAVISISNAIRADVDGKNVHFFDSTQVAGSSTSETEAYLIDDKEYVVRGGVPVASAGTAELAWALWPLDPASILSAGASGAELVGSETIEGRQVEKYTISGTGLPEAPAGAVPGMGSMGIPVTAAEGTVWVDQATGVLLRAVIDYEADVKDADGTVRGHGKGHLEIDVTQVNAVQVTLPGG